MFWIRSVMIMKYAIHDDRRESWNIIIIIWFSFYRIWNETNFFSNHQSNISVTQAFPLYIWQCIKLELLLQHIFVDMIWSSWRRCDKIQKKTCFLFHIKNVLHNFFWILIRLLLLTYWLHISKVEQYLIVGQLVKFS